jgi:ribosomal protein S12
MTEFLALLSQETRHARDDLGTVNLRTTTPKGVGVLIDHYSSTGQRSSAVKKVCSVQLQGVGSHVTLGD